MTKKSSLRTSLRDKTHLHHVNLNRHPLLRGLMQINYPLSHYRILLCAYYHLYLHLEQQIIPFVNSHPDLFDYHNRNKLPWLIKDLATFHTDPNALSPCSPTTFDALKIETIGQLVGVLYVVEGSTLGATHISQHLTKHHGFTQDTGSCFFTGYGENTMTYWQSFIAFSDTVSDEHHPDALDYACQTFQLFNQVLNTALPKEHTLAAKS